MTDYNARIEEQGNGFPGVGDYCEGEGQLWRVLEMASRIQTGDAMRGDSNYVYACVEEADYADCRDSDVHTARVVTDTQGVEHD
jgi:hypothetical protein